MAGEPQLDLAARLQRHEAFWQCGVVDRPLVHIWLGLNFLSDASGYALPEGMLTPGNARFAEAIDLWQESLPIYESVGDDGFREPVPLYLMAWVEAILGCPTIGSSNTVWVQHIAGSCDQALASLPPLNDENQWLRELLRVIRLAGVATAGHYPNGVAFLRGPLDVMSGLVGFERICEEMLDNPEGVLELADRLADVTIAIGRAQLAAAGAFAGRYVNTYKGVLAPGPTLIISTDFSAMLSPGLFRDFFLPSYRKVFAAFEYSCLHLHSAAVHVLDEVLAVDELRAIEFTMDPLGPRLEHLLAAFRRVQERKPLMVFELHQHDLLKAAEALSPRGLCLSCSVQSVEQARAIVGTVPR